MKIYFSLQSKSYIKDGKEERRTLEGRRRERGREEFLKITFANKSVAKGKRFTHPRQKQNLSYSSFLPHQLIMVIS